MAGAAGGESPGLHGAACKVSEATCRAAKAEEGWGDRLRSRRGAPRREALTAPGATPLSCFTGRCGVSPLEGVAE